MKVKDIMCSNPIVLGIDSSLFDIANVMKKYDIGFIPICNNHKIVGILTDRDIVTRIIANNDDKIDGYLTVDLITIDFDSDIKDALDIMTKHKVKRLLVVENNKFKGIISLSDILSTNIDIINNIKEIFAIDKNDDTYITKIDEFEL